MLTKPIPDSVAGPSRHVALRPYHQLTAERGPEANVARRPGAWEDGSQVAHRQAES